MESRDTLNLAEFFDGLEDYVVVKYSGLDYSPGSDIDIFAKDINELAKSILGVSNKYDFVVYVDTTPNHIYIDFHRNGKLHFRFDIHGSLPIYTKFSVKPELFTDAIAGAEKDGPVYVPSQEQDLLIRFLEYAEWIDRRPDKVKHLHYIQSVCSVEDLEISRYTNLVLERDCDK